MARLGQTALDGGWVGGEQVVPEAAIAIRAGGDPAIFAKAAHDRVPGRRYGSM